MFYSTQHTSPNPLEGKRLLHIRNPYPLNRNKYLHLLVKGRSEPEMTDLCTGWYSKAARRQERSTSLSLTYKQPIMSLKPCNTMDRPSSPRIDPSKLGTGDKQNAPKTVNMHLSSVINEHRIACPLFFIYTLRRRVEGIPHLSQDSPATPAE